MDWSSIRDLEAPYIPELSNDEDCRRFDKFDEEDPFHYVAGTGAGKKQRKDINFVGYTYKKDVEE